MAKEDNRPLTLKHFRNFENKLDERLARFRQNIRDDVRKDAEKLLIEQHTSLTEAIRACS